MAESTLSFYFVDVIFAFHLPPHHDWPYICLVLVLASVIITATLIHNAVEMDNTEDDELETAEDEDNDEDHAG